MSELYSDRATVTGDTRARLSFSSHLPIVESYGEPPSLSSSEKQPATAPEIVRIAAALNDLTEAVGALASEVASLHTEREHLGEVVIRGQVLLEEVVDDLKSLHAERVAADTKGAPQVLAPPALKAPEAPGEAAVSLIKVSDEPAAEKVAKDVKALGAAGESAAKLEKPSQKEAIAASRRDQAAIIAVALSHPDCDENGRWEGADLGLIIQTTTGMTATQYKQAIFRLTKDKPTPNPIRTETSDSGPVRTALIEVDLKATEQAIKEERLPLLIENNRRATTALLARKITGYESNFLELIQQGSHVQARLRARGTADTAVKSSAKAVGEKSTRQQRAEILERSRRDQSIVLKTVLEHERCESGLLEGEDLGTELREITGMDGTRFSNTIKALRVAKLIDNDPEWAKRRHGSGRIITSIFVDLEAVRRRIFEEHTLLLLVEDNQEATKALLASRQPEPESAESIAAGADITDEPVEQPEPESKVALEAEPEPESGLGLEAGSETELQPDADAELQLKSEPEPRKRTGPLHDVEADDEGAELVTRRINRKKTTKTAHRKARRAAADELPQPEIVRTDEDRWRSFFNELTEVERTSDPLTVDERYLFASTSGELHSIPIPNDHALKRMIAQKAKLELDPNRRMASQQAIDAIVDRLKNPPTGEPLITFFTNGRGSRRAKPTEAGTRLLEGIIKIVEEMRTEATSLDTPPKA